MSPTILKSKLSKNQGNLNEAVIYTCKYLHFLHTTTHKMHDHSELINFSIKCFCYFIMIIRLAINYYFHMSLWRVE